MPISKNEKLIRIINKYCKVDWIAELWVLTEQISILHLKDLVSFSRDYDELRILVFQDSLRTLLTEQSKYLNHTLYNEEEQIKRKGIHSLMRVKETHINIAKTSELIRKSIGSFLYPEVRKRLNEKSIQYDIEYAKKEIIRELLNKSAYSQSKTEIKKTKKNAADLKDMIDLKEIIDQIKAGTNEVTSIAKNLGISRQTVYRRLKNSNTSIIQLRATVTSVT